MKHYAIQWTISGETVIRAETADEARSKFDAMPIKLVVGDYDDLEVLDEPKELVREAVKSHG